MDRQERRNKTPWKQVSFEDKRSLVGGGRAGYEARRRHGYKDRRDY